MRVLEDWKPPQKRVAVVMGSGSDFEAMRQTFETLSVLEIPFEAHVLSAHRTPEKVSAFAQKARDSGFAVIVAAAGMAAHLAGAIAANTTLPVIGVPIAGKHFDGLDALLSTVQMPPGIPVAAVGVNAGRNAAILAAQMLAVTDTNLAEKLAAAREDLRKDAQTADTELREKLERM